MLKITSFEGCNLESHRIKYVAIVDTRILFLKKSAPVSQELILPFTYTNLPNDLTTLVLDPDEMLFYDVVKDWTLPDVVVLMRMTHIGASI